MNKHKENIISIFIATCIAFFFMFMIVFYSNAQGPEVEMKGNVDDVIISLCDDEELNKQNKSIKASNLQQELQQYCTQWAIQELIERKDNSDRVAINQKRQKFIIAAIGIITTFASLIAQFLTVNQSCDCHCPSGNGTELNFLMMKK